MYVDRSETMKKYSALWLSTPITFVLQSVNQNASHKSFIFKMIDKLKVRKTFHKQLRIFSIVFLNDVKQLANDGLIN